MNDPFTIEPVPLLEWNLAVRLMSRDGLDQEARRAAAILVLKLAPGSYSELEETHRRAGWPPPPPEAIYQSLLGEARELVTWGRYTPGETSH